MSRRKRIGQVKDLVRRARASVTGRLSGTRSELRLVRRVIANAPPEHKARVIAAFLSEALASGDETFPITETWHDWLKRKGGG